MKIIPVSISRYLVTDYILILSGERRYRGASPQKHGYVRYMSMFVIMFVLVGPK
jgi:hypothetical protein